MRLHQPSVDLRGLWVPLITPFDVHDEIDDRALARLCARVLGDGARGVVALGTTGEPATLDAVEARRVVDTCAEVCAQVARPLVVGVGTSSTRTTVAAAQALADVDGVAAALVVVPYYTRPSPAAVVEHYRVVAAESPVPVIAYNVPYRTGRALESDHLLAIAGIDNVVGVKQAVGVLDAATLELLRDAPEGFHVFAGDDALITPTILMGGAGAIAAAAHTCTPTFAAMVEAALGGDVEGARQLAELLLPVVRAGFAEPNPACWKAALHRRGEIATDALRAPMATASVAAGQAVVAAIDAVSA